MSDRDLGAMGENFIKALLHSQGCIPNKVEHDYGGWDLFLQIPNDNKKSSNKNPITKSSIEYSCLLQIKSTSKNSMTIDNIKLSNWARFAHHVLPCFFIVLEYSLEEIPKAIYVIHMDDILIEKTLSRLRKDNLESSPLLHKKMMRLRYTNHHKIGKKMDWN